MRLALVLTLVVLAPALADDDVSRWIDQLGDAKPAVRDAAQRALTGAIDRAADALRARKDDADAERKARVARLLRVATWLEELGARRFSRREKASEQLKALGTAIIPALVRRLKHEDPEVQSRSQSLLTALGWTSAAVSKELDELIAVVKSGGEKWERVFGWGKLTKRTEAVRKILELPTGDKRLARLFAERAGKLGAKIALADKVAVGKVTTVKFELHNIGKGGIWIRRGVRATALFESLQRHVRLERARRSHGLVFGGRRSTAANLASFAYLASGKTLKYSRSVTPSGFGRVTAKLSVHAANGDAQGIKLLSAKELLLRPLATTFEKTERRLAFPATAALVGALELTVDKLVVGDRLTFTLRLTNKGKAAKKIFDLSPTKPTGLWWLVRKGDALAANGWFDKVTESKSRKPQLNFVKGMLRTLEPGASHEVALSVAKPNPGTYRLQIGLGPIQSVVGDDAIWTGTLVSAPLEVVVK